MGISSGPVAPYVGTWVWDQDQRRKLAELRERAVTRFINGRKSEAQECLDDAARLERSLKRERPI